MSADVEKQRLLFSCILADSSLFTTLNPIIRPDYFEPELRSAIRFVKKYHDKYKAIPATEFIKAETDTEFRSVPSLTTDERAYCLAEMETFCRQSAILDAVLNSADLIQAQQKDTSLKIEGKIESLIRDAISVGVQRTVGHSIFDDPESLIDELEQDAPYPLGYDELDEILGGGVRRQEMLVLSANSGGGKSLLMANFACNLAQSGLNVLFISLELPVKMLKKRFATMLTRIGTKELYENRTEVVSKIRGMASKYGDIIVDKLPVGTSSLELRSYLNDFQIQHGYIPDVLCLDYLDLYGSNENISRDNVFEKDKAASEQFRELLVDFDMIGITASQQNRGAVSDNASGTKVPNMSHIAGGMSKVNTSDVWLSIIMSDIMRAAGQIGLHAIKTRSSDGVGTTLYFKYDRQGLRMMNETVDPVDGVDMIATPPIGGKGGKGKGKSNKTNVTGDAPTEVPAGGKRLLDLMADIEG